MIGNFWSGSNRGNIFFGFLLVIWMVLFVIHDAAVAADMPTYEGNIVRITPDMKIQDAVDVAQPGDVITLAPGIYYESVVVSRSGTPQSPIVITAEDPGTATISGATDPGYDFDFAWVGDDLYRANVPWTVRWVMVDGRNLMSYNDLAGLTNFRIIGHDSGTNVDGPPEGFVWVDGALYLRLLNGQDPSDAMVEIHRSFSLAESDESNIEFFGNRAYPSGRDHALDNPSGSNVTITGHHVILAGLKLHLGPLVAVNIAGDHVTIRDCYIDGAWRSIRAGDSDYVTVEYNEFSGYPAYQWVRWGSLNGRQWDLWNAIYNSNLNINHVHHSGRSFDLSHNLIYECFDCLWPRNMGSLDPADTSNYGHNAVMSCGDECIEFDTREAINLRVHDSFFMDATAVLALSPVQGGGLMIDHNIVYISSEYGLGSSVMLKFDCPWCGSYGGPTKLVTIVHNTFVNSKWRLFWTGQNHTYEDSIAENNIFYTRRQASWVNDQFTLSPYNLNSGPDMNPNAPHMSHLISAVDPDFISSPAMANGVLWNGSRQPPPVIPYQTDRLTSNDPMIDFRLQPAGVSVDAGNPALYLDDQYHHGRSGSAPDLGAIEVGDEWELATGPRWATGYKMPWRPAPPPSLDSKWLGTVPEPGPVLGIFAGVVVLAVLKKRAGRNCSHPAAACRIRTRGWR